MNSKIPVLVLGTQDYATLVFPTEPFDMRGQYITCWDRYAGHGSCSKEWVAKQPHVDPYWARLELDEYVKRYDLDRDEYEIITKVERHHHKLRERAAKLYVAAVR